MLIKHIQLTQDEEAACLEIMNAGNPRLHYWSDTFLGLNKRPVFLDMLLKGTFDLSKCSATDEQIAQFKGDLPKIMAVDGVVEKMVASYAKAWSGMARKVSKWDHGTIYDYDDFEMEAWLAARESVWNFDSSKGMKYNSFLTMKVKRRLTDKIDAANPFGGTTEAVKLKHRYSKAKVEMNGPANFDEVVEAMGLTDDQRSTLIAVSAKQYHASSLMTSDEEGFDYTELGTPLADDISVAGADIEAVMSQGEFSEWEKAVVMASLAADYGWQTRVASEHRNPKTDQPYSKAAVKGVLVRAWEKLEPLLKAG